MNKNKNNRWFEYTLLDAWLCPISCVSVSSNEKNMVCCMTANFSSRLDYKVESYNIQDLEINDASMNAIKEVLKDEDIYLIDAVEQSLCFDGYIQRFCFFNGSNQAVYTGLNIECLEGKEEYPNANIIINALHKIEKILVPLGVDKQCFSLKPIIDN